MQAVTFQELSGWLHQPVTGSLRSAGVVICDALGRDGRCGRLSMRLLAERLAGLGFAVLRYDHRGEGESLERAANEDAMLAWRADVQAATAYLRDLCGVRQVLLGGLRSGASLAALFGGDADGLLLLGPVPRGSGWLREMLVAAKVLSNAEGDAKSEVFDAEGLELNAVTTASLSALNLKTLTSAPPQIFLAAQNTATAQLAGVFETLGAAVALTDFPGFEALFEDAAVNAPPLEVIDRAAAWVEHSFPGATDRAAVVAPVKDLIFPGGVETAITFGEGLRGVLCRPARNANGQCVIFTNTGGDPRAGIGRFAVKGGRDLVRQGVASFRFDFSGIGDSRAIDGAPRSHIYEVARQAEFEAAVKLLRGRGYDHIILAGVCAGAHHALQAMAAGAAVEAVFAVNPIVLTWNPAERIEETNRDLGRAARAYRDDLFKFNTWSRVFKGQVDVKTVSATISRRLLARIKAKGGGNGEQALKAGWAAHPGSLRFLLGTDDPALDNIEAHFGANGRRLTAHPRISLQVEPRLDHGLSRAHSRRTAALELVRFIQELRPLAPGGAIEAVQHRQGDGLGAQIPVERKRPNGLAVGPGTELGL
jgi:alpha-beta hydrolase superfamily lysophospholipase